MSDIKCPRCCEPWDIDELHEYVSDMTQMFPGSASASVYTFENVYRLFRTQGCGAAFDGWKVSCEPDTTGRAEIIGMLADVLGDDVDGFASMLDDLNHMGGAW